MDVIWLRIMSNDIVTRGTEPASSSNNYYITDEKVLQLRCRFLMESLRNRHGLGLIFSRFQDNFSL